MSGKIILVLLSILYCCGVNSMLIQGEIRGFSLWPARSDVHNNRIVTGVRFVRQDSLICLQIRQGEFFPGRLTLALSGEWTTCNASHPSYPGLNEVFDAGSVIIDIDDVIVQNDRVVTGVMFELSHECPAIQHLKLRLEYATLNLTSGHLEPQTIPQTSSECHTNEINASDSPLNQRELRDKETNTPSKSFVVFRMWKLEGDVGMMLPLLDDQPVEFYPPTPLTDIRLFYEVFPEFGGSLALRIRSLYEFQGEFDYDDGEELSMDGGEFIDRATPNDLNGGIERSVIQVRRVKRSSNEWYDVIIQNPHYVYIPLLIILISMLITICWFCKCICDCFCPAKRPNVVINAVPISPCDKNNVSQA